MKSKLLLILLAMKRSLLRLQDVKILEVIQFLVFVFVMETLLSGKQALAIFM